MILPSREQFRDADDFVAKFLATLKPFSNFLKYKNFSHFAYPHAEEVKILKHTNAETFYNIVMLSENPYGIIDLGFRLVGLPEWRWEFGQNSDSVRVLRRLVENKNRAGVRLVCNFLADFGLFDLIQNHNIDEILLGIYLAKGNIFLEMFPQDDMFKSQLIDWLIKEFSGYPVTIHRDVTFCDRKFDCSLTFRDGKKFVFKFDYCQMSSAHPVRVSREYGILQYRLSQKNITLVWITDGDGYHTMKESLGRAYKTLPNIYNTKQFKKHFHKDLRVYLSP